MSKKLTFILCNIDINNIDRKYNINIQSNISDINCSMHKTNINDLQYNNSNVYSYLDEAKKTKKCSITMSDNLGSLLPKKTDISCHWCRHRFSSIPIGCPIKKNDNEYIVDGIYCSFNCVLAFIDSTNNYLYNDSYRLLNNMYYETFNKYMGELMRASSWKLLKEYGGNKTIDEFRDNFNKIEYTELNNYIIDIPKQLPIGWLHEEKITF